jgi:hypothetical protein
MPNNFNLTEILMFPLKDQEARMKFLYVSLAILAAFIIPILPMIAALGYTARVMANIIEDKTLQMPDMKNIEKMFLEGLRLWGVRTVFMAPMIAGIMLISLGFVVFPFLLTITEGETPVWTLAAIFVPMLCMFPIMLFGVAVGIILPAAECHVVVSSEFAAGFRVQEWWAIFRANLGQFLLAYALSVGISMALSMVMQALMMTVVLTCLLPLVMPVIIAYLMLVRGALQATAYRNALKLTAPE